MSEKKKDDKKEKSKKVKGETEDKEGKSGKPTKESTEGKTKKDKESPGTKEGNKKGVVAKGGDKTTGEAGQATAAKPIDPNALPPLDADGNPIAVQPDPEPSFAELWFDDPVEGLEAQRIAMELKDKIELRALPIRKFLEQAIVPLLLQGLQHMVLERPTNPAEYLAAFLLKNNPLRDVQYVEPPPLPEELKLPPKCSCCKVHCPAPQPEKVPNFFRKADRNSKLAPGGAAVHASSKPDMLDKFSPATA